MTTTIKRYVAIAKALGSMKRCEASGNDEWARKHQEALDALCADLPRGSGFDAGSKLDIDASTSDRLVFTTSFHHMDENGFYCGWTEHQVILTPAFELGYRMTVTEKNENGIKDYIAEQFDYVLDSDVLQWTGYETPVAAEPVAQVS